MYIGIFNVKTDQKAQNVTVEGTIEVEKLISFLRKRVHKNAEIISIKEVKRDQEKKGKEEVQSSETSKEKDHSKSGESTKKKDDDNNKKSGESTKEKGDGKSSETTKIIEVHQGHPKEEIKIKDNNVPYIIHYVYAPQLFSDENPNSCSIL